MKKISFVLGLGLAIAATAFAGNELVEALNAEVVRLLAPYQNSATVAQLSFGAVETNAERALKLNLSGLFRKVGSQNTLELKVDEIGYDYGDGTAPLTTIKASLGLDLSKLIPQDSLNEMIPEAEKMAQEIIKDFTKEYGEAVSVRAELTEKNQDTQGNFIGMKGLLGIKFDLAKLPEGVKSEDIFATEATLLFGFDAKAGMTIAATIVSNPGYKGFKSDQEGLKEVLEKLLARDEASLGRINGLFHRLDEMAAEIVEKHN